MRVLQRGHKYALANKAKGEQVVTFFRDLPRGSKGNHDGILTQEAVRMCLDRSRDLLQQKPCAETLEIIQLLERVLILFEKRAFGNTLEKCYEKTGTYLEQLPTMGNGHLFDMKGDD